MQTHKTFWQWLENQDQDQDQEGQPPMNHDYENAYQFAKQAHDATGAKRKLSGLPYIVHPKSVADRLQKAGAPAHEIIAAYLHDVVEDTPTPLAEIERQFGKKVAELVAGASEELSDSGGKVKLSWDDRKMHTIQHIGSLPEEVLMIVVADKLDNLEDTPQQGVDWGKFNSEPSRYGSSADKQKWYYTSLAEMFEKRLPNFPLVKQYRQVLDRIFGQNPHQQGEA